MPRIAIMVVVILGLIVLMPIALYAFLVLGTRRSAYYHYGS